MKNILNYQGNKNSLLEFIAKEMDSYLQPNKYLLDIFAGAGSISISYARKTNVIYNDLEKYSCNIIASHLQNADIIQELRANLISFDKEYNTNKKYLTRAISDYIVSEKRFLASENLDDYLNLKKDYPTIWNGLYSNITKNNLNPVSLEIKKHNFFALFTTYYANTYFSIYQAIEIDSIRFAIEKQNLEHQPLLFTALYFAMNKCVFSKDGHMAQPLNPKNYFKRCLSKRKLSIYEIFTSYLDSIEFEFSNNDSIGYNEDFISIIDNDDIMKKVGCVYADPPYTDMQYSRYYHLISTVTNYEYSSPTISRGVPTKGLYLNNRKKSALSCKSACLKSMVLLMEECKKRKINLVISFGFPTNTSEQKTDRYVMDINDLIQAAYNVFDKTNVKVSSYEYSHTNHRNSTKKSVNEYLVLCRGALI